MTVVRYGVDLTGGDGGYFLQPWIMAPGQVEPDRGDIAGPFPSLAAAEELAAGIAERMKAAVERSLQEAKLKIVRSSPAMEWRPGDEAKSFQWPEE
jgi:hypothetical protein